MNDLPKLLDRKRLAAELGVGRATVEVIFRTCRWSRSTGKVFVRREDVERLLAESTYRDDRVRR